MGLSQQGQPWGGGVGEISFTTWSSKVQVVDREQQDSIKAAFPIIAGFTLCVFISILCKLKAILNCAQLKHSVSTNTSLTI